MRKLFILAIVASLVVMFLAGPVWAGQKRKAKINWETKWADAAKKAKKADKYILLLFTDPRRCPPCRMMDSKTWPDKEVVKFINKKFVPLYINTGIRANHAMAKEWNYRYIPTIIITNAKKKVISLLSGFRTPDELLEYLKSALVLAKLEKAYEKKPKSAAAAFKLAKAYAKTNKLKEAIKLLEKVCELDSDNSAGQKALAIFELADIYLHKKEIDKAKGLYEEFIKLDPENKTGNKDDAAFEIAMIPMYKKDYETAITSIEKFMKDYPKSENIACALYRIAFFHLQFHRMDKVKEYLKQLVKEHPDSDFAKKAAEHLKEIEKEEQEKKKKEEKEKTDEAPE
jgi:tetratricopeptide (TPR) repeat protein